LLIRIGFSRRNYLRTNFLDLSYHRRQGCNGQLFSGQVSPIVVIGRRVGISMGCADRAGENRFGFFDRSKTMIYFLPV
jgi:hypothetical protein